MVGNMSDEKNNSRHSYLQIPNVCRNSSVLAIVIITQFMITIAWLIGGQHKQLVVFGLWSFYTQWVVLLATFFLCFTRRYISKVNYWFGCFSVLCVCIASLLIVELIAAYWRTGFSDEMQINTERFKYLLIAVFLITIFLLRFFEFLNTLEQRNKAESEAKLLALQSRIQPHFLFNSLNTISELTHSDPNQAEQAINSLSMLFRASLENERKHHTFENEFTLCKRYIDLERWRLGDSLSVTWSENIQHLSKWQIPKLLIQPLIENAIVHGRQNNGKVEINIDTRESNKHLSIMIENTKGQTREEISGNGIALDNIRERLQVLYDDQQTMRVKETQSSYSVLIRIPKQLDKFV